MTRAALPTRRWVLDLAASAALLLVPALGFWPTFGGPAYLAAAVGAVVLGMAIAALAAWRGFGVLVTAGITVAAYFLVGGPLALPATTVAGVVPTLDTLRGLAVGAVTSFKSLLTTITPVPTGDGLLIVPFLLGLIAAVLTTSLALRARRPAWALVPATAYLITGIALGTSNPVWPLVQGAVFGLAAVVWLSVRQAWAPSASAISLSDGAAASGSRRRVAMGAVVVSVAAVVGIAAGAVAAPSGPRYVLRDVIIPPFDIREFASPLQSFRGLVRDDASTPLFTVTGLPSGARVRIAAMDAYSGTVYNVSDSAAVGSSSAFVPVRAGMAPEAEGESATIDVAIDGYDSVWLPAAGTIDQVVFSGDRADDLRRSANYNSSSSTGVVPLGLTTGDQYRASVVVPQTPSDDALAEAAFAPITLPDQQSVPEDIAALAGEVTAEASTPVEKVRALQKFFSEQGFFSHGLEGEAISRAGHGAERIVALVGGQQMIGDDEQYAVAMALYARELGIPARVVMGYYPGEDAASDAVFTATGDDLHAWVEVAFDGFGWVTFDPTPPEDQIPSDLTTKPKAEPKPQVLQPPPPIEQPVEPPATVPDERDAEEDEETGFGSLGLIIGIAGGSLAIIGLILAPFIVIGAIKAARRRRRRAADRPSDRISGGWDEIVDRATDLGTPVRTGGTRAEEATVLTVAFAEPRVTTLATRADGEVFGPAEPSQAEIDEFWRQVDDIVGGMGRSRSVWRRLGARLNLRSLLAGTRFALPQRTRSTPTQETE